jgi:hypothetical protein
MDETKEQEPLSSPESFSSRELASSQEPEIPSELSEAAAEESRAEAKEIATSLTGFDDAQAAPPAQENPAPAPRQNIPWPEPVVKAPPPPSDEFLAFLKRTKHIWLIAAGAIFGLMALVTAQKRYAEWARITKEKRHEVAATTISPDNLLARCGQPAGDETKDIYPIKIRTMSYTSPTNETIFFSFSRTAEEKSDWVFLSMKDQTGTKNFDTPETKIAALPCLDSTK